MSIPITDPELLKQLEAGHERIELRSTDGRVFVVHQEFEGTPPPGFVPPFSDEAIAHRRATHNGGRTLAEIRRDLEGNQYHN